MKIYRCRKDIAVRFMLFGVILLAAMAYLFATVDLESYMANKYSMAFLVGGTIFALLYTFKGFNARLKLKQDEIFFWDGLADIRHIKYENIASIEYHPALRIRFQLRDRKKTVFSIPNLFSLEDADEILSIIGKKKFIKIERLSGSQNKNKVINIKSEK